MEGEVFLCVVGHAVVPLECAGGFFSCAQGKYVVEGDQFLMGNDTQLCVFCGASVEGKVVGGAEAVNEDGRGAFPLSADVDVGVAEVLRIEVEIIPKDSPPVGEEDVEVLGRGAASEEESELRGGGESRGEAAAGPIVGRDQVGIGKGDGLGGEQDVAAAAVDAELFEGGDASLGVEGGFGELPLGG